MIEEEKYRDKDGFSVEVIEVHQQADGSAICLVVQADEDKQTRRSAINHCSDLSAMKFEEIFSLKSWIYSILPQPDGSILFIHDGGIVSSWKAGQAKQLFDTEANLTKLCPSKTGAYLLGLDGYVSHFDGRENLPMPLGAEVVYYVSESPEGVVFAGSNQGGLWRRDSQSWQQLDLSTNAEFHRILALQNGLVLIAGSDGYCARFNSNEGELEVFETPDNRNYYCVAEYGGEVLFGAGFLGVEILDGTEIISHKDNVPAYEMQRGSTHLLTCGLNFAVSYDGQNWMGSRFT